MFSFCASAPGKLFLSGEYAVLFGAKAVITTVNRRILARCTRENLPAMPIVSAVKAEVETFLSKRVGRSVGRLPNVFIENRGFSVERAKIGIGSSAAIAASATGALFEWGGLPIDAFRPEILEIAMRAHRAAQGNKGSGADVAASVMGGTIVFAPESTPTPVPPPPIPIEFIWTGKSASTVELLGRVYALQKATPEAFDAIMQSLIDGANRLSNAWLEGNSALSISLTREYADGLQRLGDSAGIPIISKEHRVICDCAASFGGAAKPSGAGGGDAAVAIFPSQEAAILFNLEISRRNLHVLDLTIHTEGLTSCVAES